MAIEKDFIIELVISGIDLLHTSTKYLLYFEQFFNITCTPNYQLSDVFR